MLNIEEIRKNAPSGATHYSVGIFGFIFYYMETSDGIYIFDIHKKSYIDLVKSNTDIKPV